MRRRGDPEGAQQPDLAAPEPEALEDRLLPPGEVRPDAAEARRHLERAHVEVGAALVPRAEQSVHEVFGHARHPSDKCLIDMSILPARDLSRTE